MVIDEAHNPGLQVAASRQVDEEGTLDVDVPELVRTRPLVPWSRTWRDAAASTALSAQQLVDVRMPDAVDLATIHFRRNAFRIPVGEQPNGDDDLVNPSRDTGPQVVRAPRFVQ